MRRRSAAAIAMAAALGACHPAPLGHSRLIAASHLACPDRVLDARRTEEAVDGRSCAYRTEGGGIRLSLQPLDGRSPPEIVAGLDGDILAAFPAASVAPGAGTARGPTTVATSEEHTRIDVPGMHIDTGGHPAATGEPARLGATDDDDTTLRFEIGAPTMIVSRSGAAVIRRGRADLAGADLTVVAASDVPGPTGSRMTGYIVRGRAPGPLLVARVRARDASADTARVVAVTARFPFRRGAGNQDVLMEAANRLVARNLVR